MGTRGDPCSRQSAVFSRQSSVVSLQSSVFSRQSSVVSLQSGASSAVVSQMVGHNVTDDCRLTTDDCRLTTVQTAIASGGAGALSGSLLMRSFSSLPGLKY